MPKAYRIDGLLEATILRQSAVLAFNVLSVDTRGMRSDHFAHFLARV
jgi:hypothetical protein